MLSFGSKKRKTHFSKNSFFVNQMLNTFIACMWTARWTTLKNTYNVDIFEQSEFLRFSQTSQCPNSDRLDMTLAVDRTVKPQLTQTDHRFWKSYKAFSWDQNMRLFGRWPLGHTLESKFNLFCNRNFLHTSGLSTKFCFQFLNMLNINHQSNFTDKQCFLWLSLPSHYRVTDEALLAETT